MTDFNKIENYYESFDEKNRLQKDNSGKLEYELTLSILEKYLPKNGTILDLGGAAGVYTFPLAKKGYKMYLADLSEKLIYQAMETKKQLNEDNIISCDVVNAINLNKYENEQFDVVLLFGPLYHLLEESERTICIQEVYRVLKNGGLVFATFIPYLSGSIAILDRYFRHPEQVDNKNLNHVFNTGKFNNKDIKGFQEGYYPKSDEIIKLFNDNNFDFICLRSIRGIGYEKEDRIYNITDKDMFESIITLIDNTSEDKSIIETCGHAMFIGKKNKKCNKTNLN